MPAIPTSVSFPGNRAHGALLQVVLFVGAGHARDSHIGKHFRRPRP